MKSTRGLSLNDPGDNLPPRSQRADLLYQLRILLKRRDERRSDAVQPLRGETTDCVVTLTELSLLLAEVVSVCAWPALGSRTVIVA